MLAFFFINKMKNIVIIFYCLNILLSQELGSISNDFNFMFKKSMHLDSNNINWELIKVDNNKNIYNFKHKEINIPAIKVEVTDSINYLFMKEAITNVEKHIDFMQDSYLIISDSSVHS